MLKHSVVLLAFCAAPVMAQTCDLEGSMTVTFDGKPDAKVSSVLYGIPQSEVDKLHARALKVVDVASRCQVQGGHKSDRDHMIEFDEAWTCNGVKTKGHGVAGVMVYATLNCANKVAREFEKQYGATVKDQEDRANKGKKRAFGRD